MKKGFTLIELLAVIVILAIIALIATPIILNIIGDTKDSSVVRSGELYLDAVEQAIARANLNGKFNPLSCEIQSDSNLICNSKKIEVEVKGQSPVSGTILLKNGKVFKLLNVVLNNQRIIIDKNKKIVIDNNNYLMSSPIVQSENSTFLRGTIKRSEIEAVTIVNTNEVPKGVIESFDVSEKENRSIMAWYLDSDNNGLYELYIGGKDGVNANMNSSYLFSHMTNMVNIDISNLNTSQVTDMNHLFSYCGNLINLDLSNFDTSGVTDMSVMFHSCSKLLELNVSSFDTSSVTKMNWMFYGCSSLTNLNVSNFDTGKVTNMANIFSHCKNLTSLDVSSFNTSQVINMNNMFEFCVALKELDLSNFDTSNVTSMAWMFASDSGLTELNLDSFDTSNVTTISGIFWGCPNISTISFKNADFNNISAFDRFFNNVPKLKDIYVKDNEAKEFIESRLADINKTGVTVAIV